MQISEASFQEEIPLHVDDHECCFGRIEGVGIWLGGNGDMAGRYSGILALLWDEGFECGMLVGMICSVVRSPALTDGHCE